METHLQIIKRIIVIAGPTASGKTALAVALAKKLNTVVLSADSRQFYREMSIGTAKPTVAEQEGVPHYFIDSHTIQQEITAGTFEHEALDKVSQLFKTKDNLILVGGSGMFIDALCEGLDPIPTDPTVKEKYHQLFLNQGIQPLLSLLKEKDYAYFQQVDQHNPVRIIRALEVIELTQQPYSLLRAAAPKTRDFETVYFVLDHPRTVLYERINQRVDMMMENGLLEEVQSLKEYRDKTPLNTVGYQELFEFIDGKITLERAVELIKQHTRNYAKRQLTWFRRKPKAIWIPYTDMEEVLQKIEATLQQH